MNWNGNKLKMLYEKRSISPTDLAEQLDVSRQTIYAWISGREPRGSHLLKLCRLLEVDPQELYEGVPEKVASSVAGGKLFKRSGIMLGQALLSDRMLDAAPKKNLLNSPIRDIAKAVGLSTGSVSELFKEMESRGFLLKSDNGRMLINRSELFEKWVAGYIEYRAGQERLLFEADTIRWWQSRNPTAEGFLWGGQPAAALMTDNYLRPDALTIYTDDLLQDLIVDEVLHQVDSGGNIEFVKPLPGANKWNAIGCVHPIVVYADLTGTGDQRNHKAAQRIYDRYIRKIINAA